MCFELYKKYNVIVYVGEWFGAPDTIKFSYPLKLEKINKGMNRIANYINNA